MGRSRVLLGTIIREILAGIMIIILVWGLGVGLVLRIAEIRLILRAEVLVILIEV